MTVESIIVDILLFGMHHTHCGILSCRPAEAKQVTRDSGDATPQHRSRKA